MAVKDEIDARGLAICEAGIHGHGLASLEYPRFRHHAIAADREAVKVIGDRFEPGMVFAFNIDLLDPNWRPQAIPDADTHRARIRRILPRTDILKTSTEDLSFLVPDRRPAEAARILRG